MSSFIAQILADPIGALQSLGAIVFVFGLVIFVHEFGHFIVAKRSGVRVEQFSFGFGKVLFGFTWGETRYTVNWIPLGGYVKMAGDTPEGYTGPQLEQAPEEAVTADRSREFFGKPWWHRVLIAIAGPFMNYVLAVIIFVSMLLVWGEPVQLNKTEIGEVMDGMPAQAAGLQKGDRIVSVQGETVENFMDIATRIHGRPEQETEIILMREGDQKTVTVVPDKDKTQGIGLIGIRPADPVHDRLDVGVIRASQLAFYQCWNISAFTLHHLGQKIWSWEKPDVAGPLGIAQVITKAAKAGLEDFFYLIALISVAIGLFNLFPIPLLDGSHILYYVIEGIKGRPLQPKTISRANAIGFVLLMGLVVFATMNDVQRIRNEKASPTAVE